MTKPGKVSGSTKPTSPHHQADADNDNFSSQNNYKNVSLFPEEETNQNGKVDRRRKRKILECICSLCTILKSKYESCNIVSDTGDSIYAVPIETRLGGQVYVSEDKIRDIVKDEFYKRFGGLLHESD